ncbi:MAG: gamma-glutamyl-gamma-aminobutyrate hydrolase family protein [Bacteroidota bacterium]
MGIHLHTKNGVPPLVLLLAGFILITLGCTRTIPVKIGISKTSPNYEHWLKQSDSTLILINLYALPIDSAVMALSECGGLLLTGGEDVYPAWYGKESDTARCTEMNQRRDSLDIALIAKALELKMPVFGICRGHQILNVYLGGKLIIDIPKDYPSKIVHQCDDYLHCFHNVIIKQNSLLASLSRCDSAAVTTNHHQAIEQLSPLLTVNAHANDDLIEGFEWEHPEGKSFLMGVQWHPERMEKSNPLSGPLADEFIRQSILFSTLSKKTQSK